MLKITHQYVFAVFTASSILPALSLHQFGSVIYGLAAMLLIQALILSMYLLTVESGRETIVPTLMDIYTTSSAGMIVGAISLTFVKKSFMSVIEGALYTLITQAISTQVANYVVSKRPIPSPSQ